MVNAETGVSVPLSTFGGLSTELSPADLPEGGSPDNQDCAFIPGSVMTRPGLKRVYATPPTMAKIVYQTTFTRIDGTVFNVLMDANGAIWAEDFTNNPTVFAQAGSVTPGSYCKSVVFGGKLFLSFNDGLRGSDIPRQFDGVNLKRVSQGGPGANPCIVQDYASQIAIVSISDRSAPQSITAASFLGLVATITTAAAHGLKTGDLVYVAGVTDPVYNGTFKVTAVPSPTTFDYTLGSSPAGASSGGNEYPLTAVVTTSLPHNLLVGDIVVITGNTNAAYNNNISGQTPSFWTVSKVDSPTVFEFERITGTGGGSGTTVSVAIDGKVMPWSAPANPAYNYGINDGSAPVVVSFALSPGNVLTVTASGSIKPSDSRPYTPSPDGNPPPTGSGSGSTGHGFPTKYMPGSTLGLAGLCGAFTDAGGIVKGAVSIGAGPTTIVAPAGTTQLQLGINDDHFADNIGSYYANVTLAAAGGAGGTGGTVDIGGLSAAGEHLMVVMFETDEDYITAPSIPIKFSTAGQKKLQISNVPTGPANVKRRILGFTGAGGGRFFAVLVPAQSEGEVVSTSTTIDNNVDTSIVLDFSDETLLSATGIDVDGNNLFNLRTLGRCSGVDAYADRLFFWGDENDAINFQNMGFEGGVDPATGFPYGWSVSGFGLSVIPNGDRGSAVQFGVVASAILSQTCYQDYYGDAILEPSTQYTFQCWVEGTEGSVTADIFDPVSGMVLSTVNLPVTGTGFIRGKFSAKTPSVIPSTAVLRVYVTTGSTVITVDEMSVIYSDKPYNDTTFWASYVLNPESVDAVTGKIGASVDPTPIMDTGRLRDNFYFVTQKSLQTTKNLASDEPSGWDVNEISENCGACTMRSMVAGEGWISWTGSDGRRMFDGSEPIKITQDVQRLWDSLDQSALTAIQSLNDKTNRRIYDRVTVGGVDKLYVLDYRYGETGSDIENRPSVRVSPYTGKMLVMELSRKFSPWTVPATAIGMLATTAGTVPCFSDASGRTYRLDSTQYHDDDYGPIPSYYVTSPFVSGDLEQALQLGNFRHLYTFLSAMISGTGLLTITPLVDVLSNAWPARGPYRANLSPTRPMEIGLQVSASRVFFKFSVVPDNRYLPPGSQDAYFNLSRMAVTMQPHPLSPVYGAQ